MRAYDVATSFLASIARAGGGMTVGTTGKRPAKPLDLYEFEACPFCRKVREALSILDLEVVVHPCPQGGTRFRPYVTGHGGKTQFPFLVDPNTRAEMYESDEIIRYLFRTYGDGHVPFSLSTPVVTDVTSMLASAARISAGRHARPSRPPEQPLELWSFEASPFCRLARERLCELEIPYLLHNVAKGSAGRKAFIERSGRMMVPYLFDPNTGREMFESADICAYLDEAYGA